jgi:hypothetical protein
MAMAQAHSVWGPTHYPVLMGSSGFSFAPQGSSLGRTIGHILDHGIRPEFLHTSVAASLDSRQQDYYVSESLLDPRHLEWPVAYQTTYSSSRWGSRVLTTDEIGIAFGLPARLSLGGLEAAMFPIVPLQVLVGCLDSLGGSTSQLLEPLETPSCTPLAPIPLFTWLLKIEKRLDHSWIDHTAVSAKAAKNDGALVATHMWDQRILLPFPTIVGGLPYLRSQLMRFQSARLYREFRQHMAANHGSDWSAQLTKLRSQLRTTIQRLRQKGGGPTGQNRGESKEKEKEGKGKRRGPKARGAKSIPILPSRRTLSVPSPNSPATELLREANAGSSVHHKICNSTWWDWFQGSTLIFLRWPTGEQQRAARNGMEAYLQSQPPSFKQRVKRPKKEAFDLLLPKFQSILERGYIVSYRDCGARGIHHELH